MTTKVRLYGVKSDRNILFQLPWKPSLVGEECENEMEEFLRKEDDSGIAQSPEFVFRSTRDKETQTEPTNAMLVIKKLVDDPEIFPLIAEGRPDIVFKLFQLFDPFGTSW